MSESLTAWFKEHMARRASRVGRRKLDGRVKAVNGLCGECGIRSIPTGKSTTSWYARRAGLCSRCYGGKTDD